jgi:hypothetical protein
MPTGAVIGGSPACARRDDRRAPPNSNNVCCTCASAPEPPPRAYPRSTSRTQEATRRSVGTVLRAFMRDLPASEVAVRFRPRAAAAPALKPTSRRSAPFAGDCCAAQESGRAGGRAERRSRLRRGSSAGIAVRLVRSTGHDSGRPRGHDRRACARERSPASRREARRPQFDRGSISSRAISLRVVARRRSDGQEGYLVDETQHSTRRTPRSPLVAGALLCFAGPASAALGRSVLGDASRAGRNPACSSARAA